MIYSKPVSIPYPPVLDTSVITNVKNRHVHFDLNQLNPKFTEYLNELNLHISFAEIFYTKPNETTGIHVDVFYGDFTKLNYIYGGADSQMCWYRTNTVTGERKITAVNSKYLAFEPDQVDLIYTDSLVQPSVVQVGVPHNIINRQQDRHCLSMVIIENKRRVYMRRALDIFK